MKIKESITRVACKTDIGRVRSNNEDSIFVDEGKGIFLIADGMGGHQAGEVASDLAVKTSYAYLLERIDRTADKGLSPALIMEAVMRAHIAVREKSLTGSHLKGMGTTLVIMLIRDRFAYICHVGDSRAYLIRDGIRQITRDHTFESRIDRNMMSKGLFFGGSLRVLAQAVGTAENIEPGINQVELKEGDAVLLCTDGLTDMLSDNETEKIIDMHNDNADMAVDALIDEANRRGGRDNISVILVRN